MQLFMINGPTCVGKSTTIKGIMQLKSGLFHLSYDYLKWCFSDYSYAKYGKDVVDIVLVVEEKVLSQGHPILCDSSLFRDQREQKISKAKEYGYEIIEINIEAAPNILEERFKERLAKKLADPNLRVANLSIDRFRELNEIYNREKNPEAITYRSDVMSPEEIITEICNLIRE